jgi:hypothetical protein
MKRRAKDQLLACVAVNEAIAQEHLNHDGSRDCLAAPFALQQCMGIIADDNRCSAGNVAAADCLARAGYDLRGIDWFVRSRWWQAVNLAHGRLRHISARSFLCQDYISAI